MHVTEYEEVYVRDISIAIIWFSFFYREDHD